MSGELRCRRCDALLSPDGFRWVRLGYRVSRRVDGTPIRGSIGRPEAARGSALCRPCCDEAVDEKRQAGRNRTIAQEILRGGDR